MHVHAYRYRIRSIRRRGYYLFHHAILCGFYSRAATIRERRLLNSVVIVQKSFRACGISVNTDETEDEEIHCLKEGGVSADARESIRRHCHACHCNGYPVTRFVHVRTCFLNVSRGYYSRAATISFSTSGGAATIRERQLIESGV